MVVLIWRKHVKKKNGKGELLVEEDMNVPCVKQWALGSGEKGKKKKRSGRSSRHERVGDYVGGGIIFFEVLQKLRSG